MKCVWWGAVTCGGIALTILVIVAAIEYLPEVQLWLARRVLAKLDPTEEDDVIKTDTAEFRKAVNDEVTQRLEREKRLAEARAAWDAEREARPVFSSAWKCPKCGSKTFTVTWNKRERRFAGLWRGNGYGGLTPDYDEVDCEHLDVKCSKCGCCHKLKPRDAT